MTNFLLDSCVIIEILSIDETILYTIGRVNPPIFVDAMLDEVPPLDDLINTSVLKIVEADNEDLAKAAEESEHGPLSWQDILFYLTAQRHGFTAVTMDKKLWQKCEALNIPTLRCFQLLLFLVKNGVLEKSQVLSFVQKSQESNSRVAPEILKTFLKKLNELE